MTAVLPSAGNDDTREPVTEYARGIKDSNTWSLDAFRSALCTDFQILNFGSATSFASSELVKASAAEFGAEEKTRGLFWARAKQRQDEPLSVDLSSLDIFIIVHFESAC